MRFRETKFFIFDTRGYHYVYVYGQIISFHFSFPLFFLGTEHSTPLDVEISNKKYLARSEDLWDALETSSWWQYDDDEQKITANGE